MSRGIFPLTNRVFRLKISSMTGGINLTEATFPGKGEILIYFTFEDTIKKDEKIKLLNKALKGRLEKRLGLFDFEGKEEQMIVLEGGEWYQIIIMIGAGKSTDFTLAKFKNLLAEATRKASSFKTKTINLFYFNQLGRDFFTIGKNLALGFHLANYQFIKYKSEEIKNQKSKIKSLNIFLEKKKTGFNQAEAQLKNGIKFGRLVAKGVFLARDLVNEPASYLHPETLVAEAFKIEKESGGKIKVEIFGEEECQRLGMGGFLAVSRGSERQPKFIVLKYSDPATKNLSALSLKNKSICLIGKSITFDSGGLSLKPSEAMEEMKGDMAGGATVLGVFKVLGRLGSLGANIADDVYGLLPACENMPSGRALKPGDIVTTVSGKTIEILNTDAEGRVTLADGLSYAEKYLQPGVIIDIATLTGACRAALGKKIAGLFGNDNNLVKEFKEITEEEGETSWWLPLYKPYLKEMKSEVADLKNVSGGRFGGAITAALFLSEFVKKSKWLHLDIAGPYFNSDSPYATVSKGGTGWGVVSLIKFIVGK